MKVTTAFIHLVDECDALCLRFLADRVALIIELDGTVLVALEVERDPVGLTQMIREVGLAASDQGNSFTWHNASVLCSFVRDVFWEEW